MNFDLEIIQSSIINGKIKSAQIEANKARRYSKIKKGWACCIKKNDDDDAQNQIKKKQKNPRNPNDGEHAQVKEKMTKSRSK
jgi:hypothetical protein